MKKIKQIAWRKNLNLSKIEQGTVITGVPLSHHMFTAPLKRGLLLCTNDYRNWKAVNLNILRGVTLPVYYCMTHKQIEYGGFRLFAIQATGGKKVNVRLWLRCYKYNRENYQELENKIVLGELKL